MASKLSFLMDGSGEGKSLGKSFYWKEHSDGTIEFHNDSYNGRGHFVVASYAGAAGRTGPTNHELRIGYVMGMSNGKCWKVCESNGDPNHFDSWGIAMGWYEDTDGVFVQVSGVVKAIGAQWYAGNRVYVPSNYGLPEQLSRKPANGSPIGVALNYRDLLIVPNLR